MQLHIWSLSQSTPQLKCFCSPCCLTSTRLIPSFSTYCLWCQQFLIWLSTKSCSSALNLHMVSQVFLFLGFIFIYLNVLISGNSRSKWIPVPLRVLQGSLQLIVIISLIILNSSSLCLRSLLHRWQVGLCPWLCFSSTHTCLSYYGSLSHDLHLWMSSNHLSLNFSKPQLIWIGTLPTTPETWPFASCLKLSTPTPICILGWGT